MQGARQALVSVLTSISRIPDRSEQRFSALRALPFLYHLIFKLLLLSHI